MSVLLSDAGHECDIEDVPGSLPRSLSGKLGSTSSGGSSFISKKLLACFALLFFTVSSTVFADLSKLPNGQFGYNTFVIPLMVEITKFFVSIILLLQMKISHRPIFASFTFLGFVKFALPGFLYFISNNSIFYIIESLGPTQFQILKNLNVLSTGIFMRVLLQRHLSWLQWKALFILVSGAAVTQLEEITNDSEVYWHGLIAVIIYVLSSGAAGVFSEKLLKGEERKQDCIHWQNIQLYFFGILFGLISVISKAAGTIESHEMIFIGFNLWAYAVILSLSACGLLISFILKYLDNIAKCFVAALSMLVVAWHESFMHSKPLTMHYYIGFLLTCLALEQYTSRKF